MADPRTDDAHKDKGVGPKGVAYPRSGDAGDAG